MLSGNGEQKNEADFFLKSASYSISLCCFPENMHASWQYPYEFAAAAPPTSQISARRADGSKTLREYAAHKDRRQSPE